MSNIDQIRNWNDMNSLEFAVQSEDLVAFNTYFAQHSKQGRKVRDSYRLQAVLAGFIGGAIVGALLFGSINGALVALPVMPLIWFVSPWAWQRAVQKNAVKMAAHGGLGKLGPCKLTIEGEGLREQGADFEVSAAWSSITSIDQTENHVFIFFGPTQAFVIPKHDGFEIQPFLSEISQRTKMKGVG